MENQIKYEFPDIYKEIIGNNLLEVDYTFLLDNDYKSKNQLMDAGSINYTFSVLFKDSLFLKMIEVNSFMTWEYDANHKLTSVTSDDYVNVYGYWADLGINASTNTYSYDKKTCFHYTEAKTRHEPILGPDGSIIYLAIMYKYIGYDVLSDAKCKDCKYLPIYMGSCPAKRIKDAERCVSYKYDTEDKLKEYALQLLKEREAGKIDICNQKYPLREVIY